MILLYKFVDLNYVVNLYLPYLKMDFLAMLFYKYLGFQPSSSMIVRFEAF